MKIYHYEIEIKVNHSPTDAEIWDELGKRYATTLVDATKEEQNNLK